MNFLVGCGGSSTEDIDYGDPRMWPLIDQWNSGALFAKGRRGDPLAPDVEIRPPTNWELWVVDFSNSTIADPICDGTKMYDLRFHSAHSRPIDNSSSLIVPNSSAPVLQGVQLRLI